MRKHTLSLLATLLAYPTVSCASAQQRALIISPEEEAMSGFPCVTISSLQLAAPHPTGAMHAAQARAHYAQGEHLSAVTNWQACITQGYDILADGEHVIEEYTHALNSIGQDEAASDAWRAYFFARNDGAPVDYYQKYAACELSASHYKKALSLIEKFIALGGRPTAQTHLITAQCHTLLNNNEEAVYHWSTYFSVEKPENTHPAVLYNAAQEFFTADRFKKAAQYMDIYLARLQDENFSAISGTDLLAAKIFLRNKEAAKSIPHWQAFFANPDSDPTTEDYVRAGMAFDKISDFEGARTYFQKYYDETPKEKRILICVLALGKIYTSLNDPENAAIYFDEVLKATAKHRELSGLSSTYFLAAAATFVVLNQPEQVEKVARLHDRLKPHAASLMHCSLPAHPKSARAAPKKSKRLTPIETANIIRGNLIQSETQRCDLLTEKLTGPTFQRFGHLLDLESDRKELSKNLTRIKQMLTTPGFTGASPSHASSSQQGLSQENILTLRRHLDLCENALDALEKRLDDAKKIDRKSKIIAYLQTLAQDDREFIPLDVSPNIRAQFGHARPQGAPRPLVASSSNDPAPVASVVAPQVTFTMLPHVPGHLDKLQQISGHGKKYDMFMAEIASGPTDLVNKSGHFKALVGAKGLYAYRFDKGNRLAYRAVQTGENAYHVTILSAFGHYKNLQAQIAQSRAQTSSSSTIPAQKAKPTRGVKGKAGKGKKRR